MDIQDTQFEGDLLTVLAMFMTNCVPRSLCAKSGGCPSRPMQQRIPAGIGGERRCRCDQSKAGAVIQKLTTDSKLRVQRHPGGKIVKQEYTRTETDAPVY